jgi:uncharacterized damage-inducible protein DinB
MAALDLIRLQFRHLEWAEAAEWSCVLGSEAVRGDQNLRDRLLHIHMVQQAFLHAWRAEPLDYQAAASLDLDALLQWAKDYHAKMAAYLATLAESDLDGAFVVPWSTDAGRHFDREMQPTTMGETLLQVYMHSTYHRGQVATRLRELGATPPLTDLIVWTWFGRPAPEWPA